MRYPTYLLAAVLATEYGIGVRNGCFCAHPYLVRLLGLTDDDVQRVRAGLKQGDRRALPGMVRVSFGTYNTFEEVDRLVAALGELTA